MPRASPAHNQIAGRVRGAGGRYVVLGVVVRRLGAAALGRQVRREDGEPVLRVRDRGVDALRLAAPQTIERKAKPRAVTAPASFPRPGSGGNGGRGLPALGEVDVAPEFAVPQVVGPQARTPVLTPRPPRCGKCDVRGGGGRGPHLLEGVTKSQALVTRRAALLQSREEGRGRPSESERLLAKAPKIEIAPSERLPRTEHGPRARG